MPGVIDPEDVKLERVTLTGFVHDPAISLVLKAITLLFNNNVYGIAFFDWLSSVWDPCQ